MNGSCQCGSVKFTTPTTQPIRLYCCHCLHCQKQSTSAFGTSAIFPAFSLPKDAPVGLWVNKKTDSGKAMNCYFCKNCGSRIMHDRGIGTVSVKGGLLDGLDWNDGIHIWTKRAVVPIPQGAVTHEGQPPSNENKKPLHQANY
ncbi:hypothetical protein NA57DRAFT_63983 [Rhizodiscina lignyota]|uniref:CENP-V/GFA domain-containing protein n=1 Tax=Rhizodiscina lignyota TaxID=1504668 RepID=A0A9P4MA24_9PEZI|nr:hypothetical protein NA57DRAFT_63983 [Rhizodiscina lignyota]